MTEPLLPVCGDGFTGPTDAVEAPAISGAPTVLFNHVPTDRPRARLPEAPAIGLAGESRSRDPAWMGRHLAAAFGWLRQIAARVCHDKVFSTFDSGPTLGSVQAATETGLRVYSQTAVGMVIGAPQLRCYTMFGYLFAACMDGVSRIDRHPVMRRHPSTPMTEADLVRHLALQTELEFGVVDPGSLRDQKPIDALKTRLNAGKQVALIDVYDAASQYMAGILLEDDRDVPGPFVVSSSGLEYALLRASRRASPVGAQTGTEELGPTSASARVSGSYSPKTARQICAAVSQGFAGIEVEYATLAQGQGVQDAMDGGLKQKCALQRVAVAGGDTSSHALSELDVLALPLRCPIPGSPVCVAHQVSDVTLFEIASKGGQVGQDNYFIWLRDGEDTKTLMH